MGSRQTGYLELLGGNRSFRLLWLGGLTSRLGDWLDTIAQLTLVLRLTNSGELVALRIMAALVPPTLIGFWAGVFVDRLPRKSMMIVLDLARALLVLPLLLVHDAGQIWIVYVVTVLRVSLGAFYDPARQAVLASVVRREDLVTANTLGTLTFAVTFAGGAALGGVVTSELGIAAAFVLDSLSFVLAALFTVAAAIPGLPRTEGPRPRVLQDLVEGMVYAWRRRDVMLYGMTKALYSLGGGGVLLLLSLYGMHVFPVGEHGAVSLGILYAAVGVGAALGPLVANKVAGDSILHLRRALGPCFFVLTLGYALFAAAPNLAMAAAALAFANIGSTTLWCFSTALLQLTVPTTLQGRIFSLDLALMTLISVISTYTTGVLSDAGLSPRLLALLLAAVLLPPGLLLTLLLWRPTPDAGKEDAGLEPTSSQEAAAEIGSSDPSSP